jgi:hypothetical protein
LFPAARLPCIEKVSTGLLDFFLIIPDYRGTATPSLTRTKKREYCDQVKKKETSPPTAKENGHVQVVIRNIKGKI